MSIINENKNQIVKESDSKNYSEAINFNLNGHMPSNNQKDNYVDDLFSIKNEENNNNYFHKSNTSLSKLKTNPPQNIFKTYTDYSHKLKPIKNNDEISLSNFSSKENMLRIEFVNKLFDETSGPNNIDTASINRKITNDKNIFPIAKIESNNQLNEVKNQYSAYDKIEEEEYDRNEKNISNFNDANNIDDDKEINNVNIDNALNSNNINGVDINNKKLDLENELKIDQDNKIINGIDKKEIDINNINNNDLEVNDSINIGDIDVDALPKFNNNITFKNNNLLKIQENNDDKNIDYEKINNDELNNNLNINEHKHSISLRNKLKSKNQNKKKKCNKIINQNNKYYEEDNSNIPLDNNKNNIFEVLPNLSNKNIYKDKIKDKDKKRDKLFNTNINKLSDKNINMKFFYINTSEKTSIDKNKNKFFRKCNTIKTPKNENTSDILINLENHENILDNGNPHLTNNNIDSINNDSVNILNDNINNDINDNNILKLYTNSIDNEITYVEYLQKNNFYIPKKEYKSKDTEKDILDYKRKIILNNLYFVDYILKEETLFDKIKEYNINDPLPILYQYLDNAKSYDDNKNEFNLLFQYISDKDKGDLYQKYKDLQYNKNIIYKINPYLNDFNNFKKIFQKEDKDKDKKSNSNFEYIRFINEIDGDSFYRGFIFNYIEMNLINKNIKEISILIIDIFKLYDIEPQIFGMEKNKINIKNILICFSIIYDFIKVNLWDKAYIFFISVYNNILDKALVYYMKYNLFLFLSKIDYVLNIDNKNKSKKKKHHKNYNHSYSEEFIFYQFLYLMEYSEPKKIIFQCITYIFGISLNILYYDNEKFDNNLCIKNISFKNPYNQEENEKRIINLFFCYNNYYICYKKPFLNSNGNDIVDKTLLDIFVYNLNKFSPISKNINILTKYTYCEICKKNCNILEIKNELSNNKESTQICDQCLYLQIDEHLLKRTIFLYEENFKNYLYYLKGINLELFSQREKSIIFNLSLSNNDYIYLYNKTFNERISEIMNKICLHCLKKDILVNIECGCQICFNCIKSLVVEKTKNKIVINIYEKKKLEKKGFHCPICQKSLNIDNIIKIYNQNGINLEKNLHEAIQRLRNICKKKCLFCLKKTNKKEFESNKIKAFFKLNIIKSQEENIKINSNNLEEMLNNCEDSHLICSNCYKIISKNKKVIKAEGNIYKKIFCNICNIEHYIDMKEWNSFIRQKKCCKCIFF